MRTITDDICKAYEDLCNGFCQKRDELINQIVDRFMRKAGDYRKEKGYPASILMGVDAILDRYLLVYEPSDGNLEEILDQIVRLSMDLEMADFTEEEKEILEVYGGRDARKIYQSLFIDRIRKRDVREMEQKYGLSWGSIRKLLRNGVITLFGPL